MIPFAETSAKSSYNVSEIFRNLTTLILKTNEGKKDTRPKMKPPLPLTRNNNEDEYCKCC
jgi:hypothetical protein